MKYHVYILFRHLLAAFYTFVVYNINYMSMKHHKKISEKNILLTVTIMGVIFVSFFQMYSLHSQFAYLTKNTANSYDEALNIAINRYREYRFRNFINESESILLELSDLEGSNNSEGSKFTMDQILYKLNGVIISQTPFEINKLDSIYSAILFQKDILSNHNIVVCKHSSDSILCESNSSFINSGKSVILPKEIDSTRDVSVYFENPIGLIFKKMALYLFLSTIFMIVVIISLIYQFKIISKRKNIERVRRDFIDSMTHELKSPLQGALSLTEILENKKIAGNDQLRNDVIIKVKNNLKNLNNLLELLVKQSFAERLQTEADYQQGNLNGYIDEIIANTHLSSSKSIHFNTNLSPDTYKCWFDPSHLPSAIRNVIENAVKYSGSTVNIVVETFVSDREIVIKITDDGFGIPKADISEIFNKFYRGKANRKLTGFGLGLSYVKWVAELHNGRVKVESIEGEGSIFAISIPIMNK